VSILGSIFVTLCLVHTSDTDKTKLSCPAEGSATDNNGEGSRQQRVQLDETMILRAASYVAHFNHSVYVFVFCALLG